MQKTRLANGRNSNPPEGPLFRKTIDSTGGRAELVLIRLLGGNIETAATSEGYGLCKRRNEEVSELNSHESIDSRVRRMRGYMWTSIGVAGLHHVAHPAGPQVTEERNSF